MDQSHPPSLRRLRVRLDWTGHGPNSEVEIVESYVFLSAKVYVNVIYIYIYSWRDGIWNFDFRTGMGLKRFRFKKGTLLWYWLIRFWGECWPFLEITLLDFEIPFWSLIYLTKFRRGGLFNVPFTTEAHADTIPSSNQTWLAACWKTFHSVT